MYVFHPRAAKFEIRWIGPYEVVKQKHPSYLVRILKEGKEECKWFVRDKLRRCENGHEIIQPNEITEEENDIEEYDSDEEQDEQLRGRPNRLRREIRLPERYGEYVTHMLTVNT